MKWSIECNILPKLIAEIVLVWLREVEQVGIWNCVGAEGEEEVMVMEQRSVGKW